MAMRYSERVRKNEEKFFEKTINELHETFQYFNINNKFIVSTINKAKLIRKIYILILINIRLFIKFFNESSLKRIFIIITKKGYELIDTEINNRTVKKIIEKPILDLVTYIYKYNETISRVSYKLKNKLNEDVSIKIFSFIS